VSRHALVGIADSEASRLAFEYVLEEYPEAMITAIYAFDPTHPGVYADSTGSAVERYDAYEIANRKHGEELLADISRVAALRGRTIQTALEAGTVTDTILEYAAEMDIDHLIIGSTDQRGFGPLSNHSVATTLIERASVPVTVVP